MSEKCCGTCKFYPDNGMDDFADCNFIIINAEQQPCWVDTEDNKVYWDEGENCPCHQPRETPTERNEP